jgi:chromosome segregation ATPase
MVGSRVRSENRRLHQDLLLERTAHRKAEEWADELKDQVAILETRVNTAERGQDAMKDHYQDIYDRATAAEAELERQGVVRLREALGAVLALSHGSYPDVYEVAIAALYPKEPDAVQAPPA